MPCSLSTMLRLRRAFVVTSPSRSECPFPLQSRATRNSPTATPVRCATKTRLVAGSSYRSFVHHPFCVAQPRSLSIARNTVDEALIHSRRHKTQIGTLVCSRSLELTAAPVAQPYRHGDAWPVPDTLLRIHTPGALSYGTSSRMILILPRDSDTVTVPVVYFAIVQHHRMQNRTDDEQCEASRRKFLSV
ncbi:hypothetical protein C8J57DRAFT_1375522 [Mycena rebaudengoi]|nr:hypothetical protein C8J57DRAFT_1375522 [Mycena rebaudengoi]